ncbi:DUF4237 domain-containing protein [Lentzea tibetensis]|uniref:DUF4237 domain-containing protein n=1 Tax=Lentzea tibetensis TaxID=2591470 RepID=A0A563EFS2_9PSEU|nr:TNT domain-containing protein [Lentzea tibetensis]TWP44909.1 DUF4237 domain-containing protein [Lentzea tibetensis]
MSEPKPLNPTEQDALVKQIGLTLMRAAPEDWRQVVAEYRATGRYFELAAELKLADGSVHGWAPPQDVAALFARLRAGMHREGRGSWSNARYQLDHPSSYNLDFDRAEPKWQTPPPQQAYVDEMRFFPRVEENVPDWLRRRLGPPPPQQPPPPPPQQAPPQRGFRTARVFDGAGPNGRPSVNRPPVPEHELQQLLDYLDDAPVAVSGRGFDADVLAADAPQVVPAGFQTDGHWIWPAAVSYYLRAYGVPPEAELVERVRSADFELPEVPEDARLAAAANLGAPAAPPGTQLPVAVLPAAEADEPDEQPAEAGATQLFEPVEVEPEPQDDVAEDTSPDELTETVEDLVEPAQEPEELTDRTVVVGPVEDTANLPAVDEPQGPPYRVTFDEDGVPDQVDDRRLRETYMDGMDLFAPHADERPRVEAVQETMAWSPDQEHDTAEQDVVQETMAWSPDEVEERPQPDPVQDTMAWSPDLTEERPLPDPVQDTMAWSPEQTEERPRPDAVQDTAAWSPDLSDDTAQQDAIQDTMAWSPVLDEPEPETAAELTEEHPVVEADEPDLAEPELIPTTGHFDVAADLRDHTTEFDAVVEQQPEPEPEPEPEPRQVSSEEETKIVGTRRALDDLAVPQGAYRIGGEPSDRTWHVQLDGDAWQVAWFDHGPKHAQRFERVEDASAYLIGKLVLGNFRNVPRPPPPRPQPPATNGFREEPRRPVLPPRPPEPVAPVAPPAAPPLAVPPPVRQEEQPAKRSWPISPMNGEPPLTLFRHKQMFELPAGTEVDRYGDPTGNLAYVAGTPFPERSLVPSWVKRPYRVYRLRRPVEVLTGVAVPWFEQPGGGTAYLFPKSLEDMVADGALVEITADVHSMPKQ